MTCRVIRNWILGGYQAIFSLQKPLADTLLPGATHTLLKSLHQLFAQVASNHEVLNMKGRDANELLLVESPAPLQDEVLTVGGTIASEEDGRGFVWTPFQFSLRSHFARFEGRSGIVYSLEPSRTASIPKWLPWWILGAAAPLRVEYVRFGLEIFTSKFSITRFGSIPVVSDSLLVDIAHGTVALRLTTQQSRREICNPWLTVPAFQQLSEGLGSILEINLPAQFTADLLATGRFAPRTGH